MRPRVFPAEDEGQHAAAGRVVDASMRPRVFPAEDPVTRPRPHRPSASFNEAAGIPRGRRGPNRWLQNTASRFNEAAGIPRGRPPDSEGDSHQRGASMRPRVFPAEDVLGYRAMSAKWRSFNEAAGIPRGRHRHHSTSHSGASGFNEAAGIPRGRRITTRFSCSSMSRFNEAAGIPRGRHRCHRSGHGSLDGFNEAAGIPRGRRRPAVAVARGPDASMRPRVFPAEDGSPSCATPSSPTLQ